MAKRAAIVVACVLVIAGCLYYVLRPPYRRPEIQAEDYRRPWVCDACGHTFLELPEAGRRACPQCGEREAVQQVLYVCGGCGHEFEAYRLKDYYSWGQPADEDGQPVLPMPYFKKAGGSWTTDFEQVRPTRCPQCSNADSATLTQKRFGPKQGR